MLNAEFSQLPFVVIKIRLKEKSRGSSQKRGRHILLCTSYHNRTMVYISHDYRVLTKTQNEPKRPDTSQKEPKRTETSQNDPNKLGNDPKRPKISKLGKSGIFY